MSFYGVALRVIPPLVRWLFRVKVQGAENIPAPEQGGFLVCANHLSDADPVVITAVIRRPICYAAKAELFRIPLLGAFLRALGAIPVERGTASLGLMRSAGKILRGGGLVGVFPQGTRCPHLPPHKTAGRVRGGAGMIAAQNGVPVLPVALVTKGFRGLAPFRRTTMIIGSLMTPEELGLPRPEPGAPHTTCPPALCRAAADAVFARIVQLAEGEHE